MTFAIPTVESFTAERRAMSAAQVANGQRPLMRLSCPSVLPERIAVIRSTTKRDSAPVTDSLFVARAADGSLVARDRHRQWGGLTDVEDLTVLASHVVSKGLRIVTPDLATARRLALILGRSGSYRATKDDARTRAEAAAVIEALSRAPVGARLVPLTRCLDAKFWAPDAAASSSFSAWCRWFAAPDSLDSMEVLLDRVTAGEWVHRFAREAGRAEVDLVSAAAKTVFAQAAARAYSAATMIESAWAAQKAMDPCGQPEASTTGDAPRIRPISSADGRAVVCAVSTPCRLRPGSLVRVFGDDGVDLGAATLHEFNFDDALGMLGVFRAVSKGASRGWSWMLRVATSRGGTSTARVVAEPFLGALSAPDMTWFRSEAPSADRSREVPLDVALAGAGY